MSSERPVDVAPPSRDGREPTRVDGGARAPRRPARAPLIRLVCGLVVLVLVAWGVGELWLSIIGTDELEAVRELASHRTGALTAAARVVTWAGSAFLLVPLALLSCVALLRVGRRREALLMVIGLGGAMLLSDIVKELVSRPRPPVEHLQSVVGSSFPSGHATQASAFWLSAVFALAAAGGSRSRTRLAAAGAIAVVLAVAWSRVYLGVHYPADVIAGILLGSAWTTWAWRSVP
jgi:undecaprenyl-diphosphatase